MIGQLASEKVKRIIEDKDTAAGGNGRGQQQQQQHYHAHVQQGGSGGSKDKGDASNLNSNSKAIAIVFKDNVKFVYDDRQHRVAFNGLVGEFEHVRSFDTNRDSYVDFLLKIVESKALVQSFADAVREGCKEMGTTQIQPGTNFGGAGSWKLLNHGNQKPTDRADLNRF